MRRLHLLRDGAVPRARRGRAEPSRGWRAAVLEPPSCPGRAPRPLAACDRAVPGAAALGPAVGAGCGCGCERPRSAGLRGTGRGSGRVSCPGEGAAVALLAGEAQPGSRGFTWARSSPTPRSGSVAVPNRPVPAEVPRP